MKLKSIFKSVFITAYFILCSSYANAVEVLPTHLIPLTSKNGVAILKRAANENTIHLLSHFSTQKTVTYCGVASVVMVLNSSHLTPPPDSKHAPYSYFNQDDFFTDSVKKIISPDEVLKSGISLNQLNEIIQSYGLKSQAYFSNTITLQQFRKIVQTAMQKNDFIIANFLRSELKEKGGGHHSPIAAYDPKTDRALILDVARYKYPAYWVKTEDLWKAIHTTDKERYRGFVVIHSIIKF